MSNELNMEAERAAFEAEYRMLLDLTPCTDNGGYMAYSTHCAWRAWQAARRTTPVSAPLDEELPPLPEAFGTMENADEEGHTMGWLHGYTADQMRGYAIDHAAPYAERIHQLERELAERKPVSIDTPEFRVGEFWSSARPGEKVLMLARGIDIENFGRHKDFIRWVDGRTAGTAPDGWKLVPVEPTMDMAKVGAKHTAIAEGDETEATTFHEAMGRAIYVWQDMIAAAPSSMSKGKEEAK